MASKLAVTSLFLCLWSTFFLLHRIDGSAISFVSSSSFVKPHISNNLTLTCKLLDTSPSQPAIGKRSVPDHHHVSTREQGAMRRGSQNDGVERSELDDDSMEKRSVNQTAENMKFVMTMVITRNGVDLATISEHFPVKPLVPEVTVTGHLTNGQAERGKLQMTWPHPSQAEAGNYQCVIDTLSPEGHSIIFSQTLNIAEAEVSISDLSSKMHKLELEKEQMQLTIADQAKVINSLQGKDSDVDKVISSLNLTDHTLLTTINSLKSTDTSINQKIDNINKADTAMKADITSVNQALTSLRNIARVEPNIFFTAYLSTSRSYSQNHVIVFDRIVTNVGNAYSYGTGIFLCPQDGYYYFEVHVISTGTNNFWLEIQKNNARIISANKRNSPNYGSVSNSVTVKLRKNDQIKVVNWNSATSYIYADSNDLSTTFSGRLISL